jgi:hypothetical protein
LGNESFSGVFGGLVIVLLLRTLYAENAPRAHSLAFIGLVWGCALLSKVTAILLGPAILYVVITHSRKPGQALWLKVALKASFLVFGIAFLVAGWYFIRNEVLLGKPFYGGWEPERGFIWWQDPGYRTVQQFTTFGTALFYPVCANMQGFWDGLYSTFWADGLLSAALDYEQRPPWNYRLMLSGVWWGLIPSVMMFVGAGRVFRRGCEQPALVLAVLCVGAFFAGILYTFATVPYYCVVKSSYMTGLLPGFAVLGAAGFDMLGRWKFVRAVLWGAFACWAVAAYGAYFVW